MAWPNMYDELLLHENTTLCEVNYDAVKKVKDDDDFFTPYRCRSMRSRYSHADKYKEYMRNTLTSLSLYYEPTTVGFRTPTNSFIAFNGQPQVQLTRPNTNIGFVSNNVQSSMVTKGHLTSSSIILPETNRTVIYNAVPPDGERNEFVKCKKTRAKTAPVLPNVNQRTNANHSSYRDHLINLSFHNLEEDYLEEERLVWVEALNTWVADKSQGNHNPLPYLNFVNAVNLSGRGVSQSMGHDGLNTPILPCQRFLTHMQMKEELAKAQEEAKKLKQDDDRKKRLERAANMHLIRNQLKESQSESASRFKSKVRFEKPFRPQLFKKSVPVAPAIDPPPPTKSPSPQPAPPKEASPVFFTQPISDEEEDKNDFSSQVPTPPPRAKTPLQPVKKITPPPSPPTPQLKKEPPKPAIKPPPPPPVEKSKPSPLPAPEPIVRKPNNTKKKVQKVLPPRPKKAHLPRVKQKNIKSPREVKVKQEPPIEQDVAPGNEVSRQSSALSRVAPSDDNQLELVVTSEQVAYMTEDSFSSEEPVTVLVETDNTKEIKPDPVKKKSEKVKKERWRAQYKPKEKPKSPEPEKEEPKGPEISTKSVGDWIYDQDDYSIEQIPPPLPNKEIVEHKIVLPPDLPTSSPLVVKTFKPIAKPLVKQMMSTSQVLPTSLEANHAKRHTIHEPGKTLPEWAKKRWGKPQRDTSLADEMERERLAEERRARAQEMIDKLRNKNLGIEEEEEQENVSVDDYGWLSKYCILPHALEEMYKKTFDAVDEEEKGWLSPVDTILALRATNRSLTDTQEEYMYRILQLTGYKITDGTDFKLFAILAALSQKISALEDWMKSILASLDFKFLEMKLFMCKTLWECNVDPETNSIPINQLCVELRAGGVSYQHELEVREKLKHLKALDLLDFLTYIPLFIMLHESIVLNPLDDDRSK